MKQWNWTLRVVVVIMTTVGIGCRPTPLGPVGMIGPPVIVINSNPSGHIRQPYKQKSDYFDHPNQSLFEVKEPHKIEDGLLHLHISQEETILPMSTKSRPDVISAQVMPPGIGEHVGIAFAQSESSRGLFYLYRPVGASPSRKRCYVGLSLMMRGRRIRSPELRLREVEFQPDTPLELSVRQYDSTVVLSINGQGIGRFRLKNLRGKVGVYGKRQYPDSSPGVAKFESVQTYSLH